MTTDPGGLVLVVDDDPDIARFIEMNLSFEGFDVAVSHDGFDAREQIALRRPDLVLLDVMMPRIDGVELCRQLRADPLTAGIPVIMLTAKGLSADKVVGLTAGADDYIVKPFDTLELVARVRSTLRRNREVRGMSPLTGLPGNTRILSAISEHVAGDGDYAVCYVDMDNFKSVNDAYGFVRGDEMITVLAQTLDRACAEAGDPTPFLGHIGGDDFVVICTPDQAGPLTDRVIALFGPAARALYDPDDLARGYLELGDRQGVLQRFDPVTVSVGVASSTHRTFADPREVVAVATEMKQVAKGTAGSRVAVDRRSLTAGE
ncbi:MAG TPA: response regulator [Mycobacteriales bacterium]|nr:response regulator [Mycobacteriales bacterium]